VNQGRREHNDVQILEEGKDDSMLDEDEEESS
jgi:hypothetical protein